MKWLQWLLDNAWSVVIVGGVLAQLLQSLLKKRDGGEAPSEGEQQSADYDQEDPELAERTRRIREEIQRRIAQRQSEAARGGREAPVPVAPDGSEPPPVLRKVADPVATPPVLTRATSRREWERQAELLEQQATWEGKLREARLLKEAAARRTEFEEATADHSAAKLAAIRSDVLADLRSPEALRRAFILREVLGPPLALRQ